MTRRKRLRRRNPSRRPAARVVVVTEGKKTEPDYLSVFSRLFRVQTVEVVTIGVGADPRSVVERAIKESRRVVGEALAGDDTVWAVFDRDVHTTFDEAKQLAAGNDIRVAISNPCFELWCLFHYRDLDGPVSRGRCQKTLEDCCKTYGRRTKSFIDEQAIRDGHEEAVKRGRKSVANREREGDPGGNASTTVHRLTTHILSVGHSGEAALKRG